MSAFTLLMLLAAVPVPTTRSPLPLPEAPVRLVIPDPAAFDAALSGAFRKALTGQIEEEDPVARAWRQSRVGAKLEAQWEHFSADLPWTWEQIKALAPRSVGLALLEVGHLEAVLVVETALAALPVALPSGTARSHAGATYQLVAPGGADDSPDPERRMGLAWARAGGRLFLATSERAMRLALTAQAEGRGFAPPLPGLVGLELDLDALKRDRYFRREFLFGLEDATGRVRAALRMESGHFVEVREGTGVVAGNAASFDAEGAAAAGWQADGSSFWHALRAGLLEPIPRLAERPVPSLTALPALRTATEDRYLLNLETAKPTPGAPASEEGELAAWRELLAREPIAGWGYRLGQDGSRRLVLAWPEARQAELEALCRATVERRAGRATLVAVGDAREIRVGPELPALALRRTGEFVWIGPSAHDLAAAPRPTRAATLTRWGRVDLRAVRATGARWPRAEGPQSPESLRPFSDRVLGLLGWMPSVSWLSVERRQSTGGWSEQVVFGGP
jgi:hypothetical protein